MRIAIYSPPFPADKNIWKDEDWFKYEMAKKFSEGHPQHDFLWITPYAEPASAVLPRHVLSFSLSKKDGNAFSSYITMHYKLPALLKKQKADVLLSLDGSLPVIPLPTCLLIREMPEKISSSGRKNPFLQKVQKSTSLAVVAQDDKEKLVNRYHISPQKITAVKWGIRDGYQPMDWEMREQVKNEFTDGKEYFLYIGEIQEQKNILNLLKAFSILKKRLRSNMILVLAGELHRQYKAFPQLLETYYFKGDVKWVKKMSAQDRVRLIGAAYGLICPFAPTRFRPEMLDAFACRVPVITADNALSRETTEDAALYFDPLNIDHFGNALCEIYKDENLRGRLIALGDIQAAKYSWEKTSDLLWSALKAAIQ